VERDLVKPKKVCVLDLGAGSGITGEDLLKMGLSNVYGIDIEPEAVKTVKRDRPFVYKAYFVVDLMQLSDDLQTEFETTQTFNGMMSVGSLGFDDIPPKVFGRAFNMLTHSRLGGVQYQGRFFIYANKIRLLKSVLIIYIRQLSEFR
jgi:hypothetical protein